jgi:hypothetical protein
MTSIYYIYIFLLGFLNKNLCYFKFRFIQYEGLGEEF